MLKVLARAVWKEINYIYFPHCISNGELCYDILFHLHFIISISIFNFFFLVAPHNWGILVPGPQIEPRPQPWEHQVLTTWTTRELLLLISLTIVFNWSTVNWQCSASFRYTAKWFSFIYVCVYICLDICTYFPILFSYGL